MNEKLRHIIAEIKGHAPFTIFGALTGILLMFVFRGALAEKGHVLFAIFHPAHVFLSAMVTASIFAIHRSSRNFVLILLVGYFGSIGVATLSDCVVPYFGEKVLGLHVPSHADVHGGSEDGHEEGAGEVHQDEEKDGGHLHNGFFEDLHLGFIEEWYIVNPAAILGVLIAFFIPRTKFPHAGHVLLSTWASSAHIMMNSSGEFTVGIICGMFVILFLAVWLPCCISDIIFPLLFVNSDIELRDVCSCSHHSIHSHPHNHKHSEECNHGKDES